MKNVILTLAFVLTGIFTFASTGFENSMKTSLEKLRADNASNYIELAEAFTKIGIEYKDRFEPFYYSAFCYILESWKIEDPTKKKEILTSAKAQLDKANKLVSNNDELMVMEALYYQAYLLINPREYGNTYSTKAEQLLQTAQAINKSNPRALFLRAQNIYHRPAEYGGGKEKAYPMFKESAKLFKQQSTDNYLLPLWGEDTNKAMIKQCETK